MYPVARGDNRLGLTNHLSLDVMGSRRRHPLHFTIRTCRISTVGNLYLKFSFYVWVYVTLLGLGVVGLMATNRFAIFWLLDFGRHLFEPMEPVKIHSNSLWQCTKVIMGTWPTIKRDASEHPFSNKMEPTVINPCFPLQRPRHSRWRFWE